MPSVTLPKGGGAIRGIGEKFAANPVTGTGSLSVPIATSPGRSGFGPELSLGYDSGSGNGPFGLGWSLALPAITRKTDKGLPQYDDASESDVFVLSGAEDLVPLLVPDGAGRWLPEEPKSRTIDGATYRVRRYRPRIEGLFARIERWSNAADRADTFWRSISRDNVTTWYGRSADSRIADPADPARIFSWLICLSHDDRGNAAAYGYKAENSDRVFENSADEPEFKVHERNRSALSRSAQRYLKFIRYGNRTPFLPVLKTGGPFPEPPRSRAGDAAGAWMFEVVFDYGEHVADEPAPDDAGPWPARPDPFSNYRAGFDLRTYRLCRRVLMFHHFAGEADVGDACLVRSTDFTYWDQAGAGLSGNSIITLLHAVTTTGYRRSDPGGYVRKSLPPVELRYSEAQVQQRVEVADAETLENLPIGVDGAVYSLSDLHGEGLPGVLSEQGTGWFYKRNLGPLGGAARFAPIETVALKPNVALHSTAGLMDLEGDGQPDLVVLDGPVAGYYEHDTADGWEAFRPFAAHHAHDFTDPNLRLIDLNGDGHLDIMLTEDDSLVWYPSLAEAGFGAARRVSQALDEEQGPRLNLADAEQAIFLADMSGDGLTDLVRVRNSDVCYWPNLGYGRFGAKVTMAFVDGDGMSACFDQADHFDHKLVRLADIDGSGTADIIYLHRDGVRLYFNESGNGWSQPQVLPVLGRTTEVTSVIAADLLGTGTASLVWSSRLPTDAGWQLRYVDLMGGLKPHLLIGMSNNLGAETTVGYAPSTRFYLQDKRDGKPWITRLPFPVHVVDRVETLDHVSRTRFVTRYGYHHGYFDGQEREFRGFGMVEQWDTEQFAALSGGTEPALNIDAGSHVPPVYTKTWFHTGAWFERDRIARQFEGEYFRAPGDSAEAARAMLLANTILPASLTPDEEREASRALKGSMLRQETYALDGRGRSADYPFGLPYTVAEQNSAVRCVQPRGGNPHAVFLTHPAEAVTYRYERGVGERRIEHAVTLEVDRFGNVIKQAEVGYGKAASALPQPEDRERQETTLVAYTEHRLTHDQASGEAATELDDVHRLPLPCETKAFELTGFAPTGRAGRYRAEDFVERDPADAEALHLRNSDEVPFEADPTANPCRRLIACSRTLYRKDDLSALLPLGSVEPLALAGETYRLAFTPGLLDAAFVRPDPAQTRRPLLPQAARAAVLGGRDGDEGGYFDLDGNGHWWIPSGRAFFTSDPADSPAAELAFARTHFFVPRRTRDAFGTDTAVDYDAHDLLVTQVQDALGNRITAALNDYRVLQPRLVRDPNGNRAEAAFDALGWIVGTALSGKDGAGEGDSLAGFEADLPQERIDRFLEAPDPHVTAADLLQGATTRIVYDTDRFRVTRQAHPGQRDKWLPACVATLARETHAADPLPPQGLRIGLGFAYCDGFGRDIQRKGRTAAGPLPQRDSAGAIVLGPNGQLVMTAGDVDPRWITSGWTVFNNKGNPVRQYEPFFTDNHRFEFDVRIGVSVVLFYDPAQRVVATIHPDNTFEKVTFDPWSQTSWDANDCSAPRGNQTGDPRTDPDIAGYVARYFDALDDRLWRTWHGQRIGGERGAEEQSAAQRAAQHAATPTVAHLDALGRAFLTIGHNRVVCAGHPLDGQPDEFNATRVALDIMGHQRAVFDERTLPDASNLPLGPGERRLVMRYARDMTGSVIRQSSMEAGERWTLNDVSGQAIRAWDSRGHNFVISYDALRRPVEHRMRGTFSDADPLKPNSDPRSLGADLVVERIEYGEPAAGASAAQEEEIQRLNLRTRILRHFDSAGVITQALLDSAGKPVEAYDFKGNSLHVTRQFVRDYKNIPDWSNNPPLADESFVSSTRHDALNRPILSIAPFSSVERPGRPGKFTVVQPTFDPAGQLERLDVWLERSEQPSQPLDPTADPPSPVGLAHLAHNAKGQRERVDYKNGTSTVYGYDPLTYRLTSLNTRRPAAGFPEDDPQPADHAWPGKAVQSLGYTYDPVGNIVHIRDDAQQAVFFNNKRVEPGHDYLYDALYRLIQATGREHLGQVGGPPLPHSHDDGGRVGKLSSDGAGRFGPSDGKAMGTYTERYVYDAVGNFLQMRHRGDDPANPGWTRIYAYDEASLLEPGKRSNRLSGTRIGSTGGFEPYLHDVHGNMLRMPHLGGGAGLPNMDWDYRDCLRRIDRGGGGEAFYAYDASGQRVRKVCEKNGGAQIEERIYLGGFEIYREHRGPIGPGSATLERETLHVMDDRQRIALVETRTLDTAGTDPAPRRAIRYQLGNHLGSSSLELDEAARIISYEEYTPYGSSSYQAVRSATETAKRYRYTGMERDEESGLGYHAARYYAPWLGRWTSCDPMGTLGGANLYRYAAANPARFTDATGYAPKKYESQRGKDTKAKKAEMDAELAKSQRKGYKPDPMQNKASDYSRRTGNDTPIQQHHHRGVKESAKVKLPVSDMGTPMSSVYSTKRDPGISATIDGKPSTHHNVAKHLDLSEQAKGPATAEGLRDASMASKWRLPATADMTERATLDWTRLAGDRTLSCVKQFDESSFDAKSTLAQAMMSRNTSVSKSHPQLSGPDPEGFEEAFTPVSTKPVSYGKVMAFSLFRSGATSSIFSKMAGGVDTAGSFLIDSMTNAGENDIEWNLNLLKDRSFASPLYDPNDTHPYSVETIEQYREIEVNIMGHL